MQASMNATFILVALSGYLKLSVKKLNFFTWKKCDKIITFKLVFYFYNNIKFPYIISIFKMSHAQTFLQKCIPC